MTAEIKQLFQINVELLELMDKAVLCFREQNYPEALEYMPEVSGKMRHMIDGIIGNKEYFELVSTDSLMEMLAGIVEATKAEDYVLLADLLELQLSTLICNVQELIMNKEDAVFFSEEMYREQCRAMKERLLNKEAAEALFGAPLNPAELLEQGYRVEVTSCGLMTVAVATDRGSVYLHSNHKVSLEAHLLVRRWVESSVDTYYINGFGLGYHAMELLKLAPEAKIVVCESDGQMLKLACAFSPMRTFLASERVSICYDADGSYWKSCVDNKKEGEKLCLYMPSIQAKSALF